MREFLLLVAASTNSEIIIETTDEILTVIESFVSATIVLPGDHLLRNICMASSMSLVGTMPYWLRGQRFTQEVCFVCTHARLPGQAKITKSIFEA